MQCHLCNTEFTYDTDLSDHLDIHHKYFTCILCGKGFGPGGSSPESDRNTHFRKQHSKAEQKIASKKQSINRQNNIVDKEKTKLINSLNKSKLYLTELQSISQDVCDAAKKMKWKCKYESQYMITKKQQTTYSEKYRMIKKRYKNGLIKIHDLANHLDVEKKHVLPGVWCKPHVWGDNDCLDQLHFFQ